MSDDDAISGDRGGYVPCGGAAATIGLFDDTAAIFGVDAGYVPDAMTAGSEPASFDDAAAVHGSAVGFVARPCGCVLPEPLPTPSVTQTFADRAWAGRVIHQFAREYSLITGDLIEELEQYARARDAVSRASDTAEADYTGRANAAFEAERFVRAYVRHTAPVGATDAVLRLRMYAESQVTTQADIDAVGAQPTPWQLWTWSATEWLSSDTTGLDITEPSFTGTGPVDAATAYNSLGTLLASGSLTTDGSDGTQALLAADNDFVTVAVPIVAGEVRFAFVVPESIGNFNATYTHDAGSPGETEYGVLGVRFHGLRDMVTFDLSGVFPDIDDSIWGEVIAGPAKQAVDGFTTQRYELLFYNSSPCI